ncbi:hypothetical protein RND81_03G012000 [Saponaria officinalis]|uniref:Uncharacterized protein n=1 Tax=Saponaria officinalis TaxID=3572 RepID=A0AAW1LXT7_SAPOF
MARNRRNLIQTQSSSVVQTTSPQPSSTMNVNVIVGVTLIFIIIGVILGDSEQGFQLQQMIEEACQKREKLETNLKLWRLSIEDPNISGEQKGFFPVDLTTDLFISAVEDSYKAIHDFSKPLINMMKVAKWDLDAAAESIEPSVVYAKRTHRKYAFESYICQKMFLGFKHETFTEKPEDVSVNRESFFHQYLCEKWTH